jgi:hypothetical protein
VVFVEGVVFVVVISLEVVVVEVIVEAVVIEEVCLGVEDLVGFLATVVLDAVVVSA